MLEFGGHLGGDTSSEGSVHDARLLASIRRLLRERRFLRELDDGEAVVGRDGDNLVQSWMLVFEVGQLAVRGEHDLRRVVDLKRVLLCLECSGCVVVGGGDRLGRAAALLLLLLLDLLFGGFAFGGGQLAQFGVVGGILKRRVLVSTSR